MKNRYVDKEMGMTSFTPCGFSEALGHFLCSPCVKTDGRGAK